MPPTTPLRLISKEAGCESATFPGGLSLRRERVCLTSDRLWVGRRVYLLSGIRGAFAVHEPPRIARALVGALVSMSIAVPLMLARFSGEEEAGVLNLLLALAAAITFSCLIWVVVAEDAYWLVIVTPQGRRKVLVSDDYQLVLYLVALLGDEAGRSQAQKATPPLHNATESIGG